jgi:hypothetical protein
MFFKILTVGASSLVGLVLTGLFPPPPPDRDGPPPPKEKGKAKAKREPGPAGDLQRAYELLRRLRADGRNGGRPEERLRDWTERATQLYRQGIRADEAGDPRLAHEYGAAAHDLARAVDHAKRAALYDTSDPELPAPPPGPGPDSNDERVHRDLRRAYERIQDWGGDDSSPDARSYLEAARDLYSAARRDAEDGRLERAGELSRAAEAMTHVPEHLTHATDITGPERGRELLGPGRGPDRKDERPKKRPGRFEDRLPPPLRD